MIIQCTKELLNKMKCEYSKLPDISEDLKPFYWNSHVIKHGNVKTLIIKNDYYSLLIIIHRIKEKEFLDFAKIFKKYLQQLLNGFGLDSDFTEKYLDLAGDFRHIFVIKIYISLKKDMMIDYLF